MLIKLLKYDFKRNYKAFLIFYTLAIVFAALTRLFFSLENSMIMYIIGQICTGATIAMICNTLINNLMRLWVSFKNNLYGDESYLTHTLPASKSQIYLSKIVSSVVIMLTSFAVITLTLFIAYYSKENMEMLKAMLTPIGQIFDSNITVVVLVLTLVLFVEFLNGLQVGYTGIILGHKMNNGKTGFSVLFGFIAYTVTQCVVLLITFIAALFNSDLMAMFTSNAVPAFETFKFMAVLAILSYTAVIIATAFVNIALLKKGVNVD